MNQRRDEEMPETKDSVKVDKVALQRFIQEQAEKPKPPERDMSRKRPIGVIIVCLASILYGVLDIGQFFMPTVTEGRIEYSIPFLGILLLIFGFGTLALKEWARKGMVFAFIWAVFQSALAIYHGELIFGNVVFITLYCSIILYLSRPGIRMKFKRVDPESGAELKEAIKMERKTSNSKEANYLLLKQLISEDEVLLLPHKKYKGLDQMSVYTKCGTSLEFFENAYINGDIILQFGELGPRVGHPVSWEETLADYLNSKL